MNANVSGLQIIDSGTVVAPEDGYVEVVIIDKETTDESKSSLAFRFSFIKIEGEEQSVKFKVSELGDRMDIRLINADGVLGTGNTETLNVATFGEVNPKKVYLDFALYSIGKLRLLHYTFTLEN